MSPALAYGRGRSSVACTTANSAVGAAMPSARAPTAVARNDGCRNSDRSAALTWNITGSYRFQPSPRSRRLVPRGHMLRLPVVTILGSLAAISTQPPASWQPAPTTAQMLAASTNCWEPALAVGPRERVYIVAGQRSGPPGSKDFDQKQVLWRSLDGGTTFEGPWPVSTEGHRHGDQRIAVDREGIVYVSYMDNDNLAPGASVRLRLARSSDEGRTFTVQTIPGTRVSDKPELAVSADGRRTAIVYESSPGPTLVTSGDGGRTWNEARMVEPGNGRHFWPESLAFAPDGALWFAVPSMSDDDIAKRRQTVVQLHVFRSADDGRSWQESRISSSPRFINGCAH